MKAPHEELFSPSHCRTISTPTWDSQSRLQVIRYLTGPLHSSSCVPPALGATMRTIRNCGEGGGGTTEIDFVPRIRTSKVGQGRARSGKVASRCVCVGPRVSQARDRMVRREEEISSPSGTTTGTTSHEKQSAKHQERDTHTHTRPFGEKDKHRIGQMTSTEVRGRAWD